MPKYRLLRVCDESGEHEDVYFLGPGNSDDPADYCENGQTVSSDQIVTFEDAYGAEVDCFPFDYCLRRR